jgi:hypothetical protein
LKEQQDAETKLYETTKQSLIELLKTDNNLLKSIFGRNQPVPLNPEPTIDDLRREAQKHLQDLNLKADRHIDMELEYNDILKASLCSFKFIALKTPASSLLQVPSSIFFTFSFYTFPDVTSEVLYLKSAQQIESGDLALDGSVPIAPSKQYFLVYKDLLRMLTN